MQWLSECPSTSAPRDLCQSTFDKTLGLKQFKFKSKTIVISNIYLFLFDFNKKIIFYHFLIKCTRNTYISFSVLFPIKYENK